MQSPSTSTTAHAAASAARTRGIPDQVAKRVTTDLCRHLDAQAAPATVIEMYEWVREGNVPAGELHDMEIVAHHWSEHQLRHDHSDWVRRTFGE